MNAWRVGKTWTPSELRKFDAGGNAPIDSTLRNVEIQEAILRYMALERGATTADAANPSVSSKSLYVNWAGLKVSGATIVDGLDLSGLHFDHPLTFTDCSFGNKIDFTGARLGPVDLSRSRFFWLEADAAHFSGDLSLPNIWCLAMNLRGATIEGLLWLDRTVVALQLFSQLREVVLPTLDGKEAEILADLPQRKYPMTEWFEWAMRSAQEHSQPTLESSVRFRTLRDTVNNVLRRLQTGTISATALASALKHQMFGETSKEKPEAEQIEEWGRCLAKWSKAAEQALTTGEQFMSRITLEHVPKDVAMEAFVADALQCNANAFFRRGFTAFGHVNLVGARVGGSVALDDVSLFSFRESNEVALDASRIDVAGPLRMTESTILGSVMCSAANVGGRLVVVETTIVNFSNNPDVFSFNGGRAQDIFLRDQSRFFGRTNLIGAQSRGDLDLSAALFFHPNQTAIVAERTEVRLQVFLRRGFTARGRVVFSHGRFGGDFVCRNADLRAPLDEAALDLEGCEVHGALEISAMSRFEGTLDLTNAKADTFCDDCSLWGTSRTPRKGWAAKHRDGVRTLLNGFSYKTFTNRQGHMTPTDADCRIAWLKTQPAEDWQHELKPQPWEQCAQALSLLGQADDAKRILYAREVLRTQYQSRRWRKVGRKILGLASGYGYYNFRALWWSLGWVVAGTIVFLLAHRHGLLERAPETLPIARVHPITPPEIDPQESLGQPDFHAFWYSLDTFVPVVDLRQAIYWIPKPVGRKPADPDIAAALRSMIPAELSVNETDISESASVVESIANTFTTGAGLVWLWTWLQIIAGWVLTTIAILGFTGTLERRDTARR